MASIILCLILHIPFNKTGLDYDIKVHGFLVSEVYNWEVKRDGMRRIISAKPRLSFTQIIFYDEQFRFRGYWVVRDDRRYRFDDKTKVLTLIYERQFKRIKYATRYVGTIKSFYDSEKIMDISPKGRLPL
jgi:hypothetical protein